MAAVCAALLGILCAAAPTQAADGWSLAADMSVQRVGHQATLLSGGKVLVTGGSSGFGGTASAELYDPATGMWSPAASMSTARRTHTATLLPGGKVLVAGGMTGAGDSASAELYDAGTDTWSAAPAMSTARYFHTATPLADGKVLVTGGATDFGPTASAELYDPVTSTWSAAAGMTSPRYYHAATLLADGRVLVTAGYSGGSYNSASGEVYDPVSNTWSTTPDMSIGLQYHAVTLLGDGKILVAGGNSNGGTTASAERYDPVSNAWSAAPSMTSVRANHTATLRSDGKVLVAGGSTNSGYMASAELYDPVSNTWSAAPSMSTARSSHTATLLPGGKVLVTGGMVFDAMQWPDPNSPTMSVELYGPDLELSLDAATLAFGSRDIAAVPSVAQVATLTNSGSEPVTLTGVSTDGPDADEFVRADDATTDCAPATVLPARQSCAVRVQFNPASLAARTATVSVTSTAATVTIALTGTGTRTELSRTAAAIDFGDHDIAAGATAGQATTIVNTGTEPVMLSGLSLGGPDSGQFERLTGGSDDCTTSTRLAAGQRCDVRVRFDPTAAGAKTATATIASNATDVTVALIGNGRKLPDETASPVASKSWLLELRAAAVKVSRRRGGLHVATGYAAVCPAGGPDCSGRVTLKVMRRTRTGQITRVFLTGERTFVTVAAGTERRLTMRLSASGARRLRRLGTATVILRGSLRIGRGASAARHALLRVTAPRER